MEIELGVGLSGYHELEPNGVSYANASKKLTIAKVEYSTVKKLGMLKYLVETYEDVKSWVLDIEYAIGKSDLYRYEECTLHEIPDNK